MRAPLDFVIGRNRLTLFLWYLLADLTCLPSYSLYVSEIVLSRADAERLRRLFSLFRQLVDLSIKYVEYFNTARIG